MQLPKKEDAWKGFPICRDSGLQVAVLKILKKQACGLLML